MQYGYSNVDNRRIIMSEIQNCCNKPQKAEKFLKICLLTLLYDQKAHGYFLIEELESYGFRKDELSISTLYRNLRKMEAEKLVLSSWEKSEGGPRKRVYTITDEGKKSLEEYINFLKFRKSLMDKLINTYENKINDNYMEVK
jgi:DNA-binding PadR family transcriptional regulator